MSGFFIGIDVGGTNLKAGLTDETGRLQVGAAHVDTDEESAHFCFRLPCSARRSTRWASSWAALKP